MVAPGEYRTKDAIISYFEAVTADFLSHASKLSEEEATAVIPFFNSEMPIYAVISFIGVHTAYHDAQLNFIQSLGGDTSMHWG